MKRVDLPTLGRPTRATAGSIATSTRGSVRVIGDEPVYMYLSVTPHIQPTHTMYGEDQNRLPPLFRPSSDYDTETDSTAPVQELVDQHVETDSRKKKAPNSKPPWPPETWKKPPACARPCGPPCWTFSSKSTRPPTAGIPSPPVPAPSPAYDRRSHHDWRCARGGTPSQPTIRTPPNLHPLRERLLMPPVRIGVLG